MRKRCLKGFVVGLSTLVAVSGAAASPPGALEVKGALAAISAESITVGGITCQANAQTKYEKNDQHVTAAAFAVGELVELTYLIAKFQQGHLVNLGSCIGKTAIPRDVIQTNAPSRG